MGGVATTNILVFGAVAVLVVLLIVQRVRGTRLQERKLLVLPGIFAVLGVVNLSADLPRMTALDVVMLAIGAAVSFGMGLLRGGTTRVYAKDGVAYFRYTWITVVCWLGLIPLRVGLIALERVIGANVAGGTGELWLLLAITFAAEAMLVLPKARRLGVPTLSGTRDRAGQSV